MPPLPFSSAGVGRRGRFLQIELKCAWFFASLVSGPVEKGLITSERESMKFRLFSAAVVAGGVFALIAQPVQGDEEQDGNARFDRLEWRGMLAFPGKVEFSLHDPRDQRGFWLTDDGHRYGVEVEKYDAEDNSLTIRYGSRTRILGLAGGGVVGMAPAAPEPPVIPPAEPDGAAPDVAQDEPAPPDPELGRIYEKWNRAIEESPVLQQIRQQAGVLHREANEIARRMVDVEAGTPEAASLQQRHQALRNEILGLERDAVNQAQLLPGLRGEEMEALVTSIGRVLAVSFEPIPEVDPNEP